MNKSKKIEYLVGNNRFETVCDVPYSDLVCQFLSDLSENLANLNKANDYPDIKTLSFWCRKQNIDRLKNNFYSGELKEIRLGLGLVFHITPSNIPTNFAYSLFFGLLTGNSNIIKVPSKKFAQVAIICNSIKKILNKKKFFQLKRFITIVRYKDNDELTSKVSSICDARLIWGGKESITSIREFKMKERSIDIAFSDRFSFCTINAKELSKLNNHSLDRFIERFYNDTYLVDQNACSSPHIIVWLNDKDSKVKNIFWEHLFKYVSKKYTLPPIAAIDKYTKLYKDFLDFKNIKSYKIFSSLLYVVNLKNLNDKMCDLRGKWGYFYEYDSSSLKKIAKYINKNCQTLTYFGVSKKEFNDFIFNSQLSGVDRIVPIGQALDINLNWDGYDINKTLTRVVDFK